jgi:probable lipoprotein NlpC
MNKLLVCFGVFFWLVGCSSIPGNGPVVLVPETLASETLASVSNKVDMANYSQVRSQLLRQLNEWQGVPHRDGGLSKQGVDCSGFVYLTFADEFGIRLPRTTQSQVLKGIVVEQSDLLPGDLVFFQTGIKQRHVGIYVGKNQFIHTSSSRGVMTSRLDNPYWQDAYWHSRRVADLN